MVFLIPLFSFILYCFTLSNTIFGGDAGDMISAILTKGFAHPPGYPLYIILGIIFNKLPLLLTPAGKVTLISGLAHSFSLMFVYLIIKELDLKKFNWKIALIAVSVLAFNSLIWLYSVVPEVFPLNNLLIFSAYYCMLKWSNTPKDNKYGFLTAFIIGLSFTHHHTFFLVIPGLLYLFFRNKLYLNLKKTDYVKIVVSFTLGLLSLLYLPYSFSQKPLIAWADLSNLKGYVELLTRLTYGTFVPGQFITQNPGHRLLQIKNLWRYLVVDFRPIIIVFFLLALKYYFKIKVNKEKIKFNSLLINVFFFGPFFVFYANFPLSEQFFFATIERFYLAFYFFIGILVYFGLSSLQSIIVSVIANKISHPFLKRLTYVCFFILLLTYPFLLLYHNFPSIILLKNDITAENMGVDIIKSASKKSIILLNLDTPIFNTQYIYFSRPEIRQEKVVVQMNKLIYPYYLTALRKHYPQLELDNLGKNPLTNFVVKNIKEYAVYTNQPFSIDYKKYHWQTSGLLFELVPENKTANLDKLENFWQKSASNRLLTDVKNHPEKFYFYFLVEVLRIYGTGHANTGFSYLNRNEPDKALSHIQKSISFFDQPDNDFLMADYYLEKNDCQQSLDNIKKALDRNPDNQYLDELSLIKESCYKDKPEGKTIDQLIKKYSQQEKTPLNQY